MNFSKTGKSTQRTGMSHFEEKVEPVVEEVKQEVNNLKKSELSQDEMNSL